MTSRRERIVDEALVLACQDGSREAFQHLVERWQPRLVAHARRMTGRADVANDVVQETWIDAARGLPRLRDPGAFPRWIYAIASRRAADAVRRRPRDEDTSLELDLAEDTSAEDERGEAVRVVRRAIASLPADRRTVLSLHYLEEFEVREIAQVLDVPEGTVKSRLHQARLDLRAAIERHES